MKQSLFVICILLVCCGAARLERCVAVPNRSPGVCWFASAETVLRNAGHDIDLVDAMQADGVGSGGATPWAIYYYDICGYYDVHYVDLRQMCVEVHGGTPVIAHLWPREGREFGHAVVVLEVSEYPIGWYVRYWDCNYPWTFRMMSWSEFKKLYRTGTIITPDK